MYRSDGAGSDWEVMVMNWSRSPPAGNAVPRRRAPARLDSRTADYSRTIESVAVRLGGHGCPSSEEGSPEGSRPADGAGSGGGGCNDAPDFQRARVRPRGGKPGEDWKSVGT